ncbi:hypothetical protein JCM10914A_05600 [Paenibacillus sp. JCM 10914]|uniref:MGH1-like glycoside hydrolase domain-containing protein n=1 Tax=Paenibacillus sp. JCM 10914 TaxID=1236974 RepID=UPI0003CC94EB|nr:hypothetical protein [Paenibacillus sp. JCM 10914]GAE07009.1 hypothetical protein JCM10914_3212 [Paenibacillus sp. JCM 10914]
MTHERDIKSKAGAVSFQSSDKDLNEGFTWAKGQALEYAHFGEDPVGLWYEAALPAREAFCIRDVMHHSTGAAVLGLRLHSKNMIMRFAENIAESRDWCTYWEINKDNMPAPVDYASDEDFWYNLPANFDIIDASWRQYLWTGDPYYLKDSKLWEFFNLTLNEYTSTWDKDGDGILEYYPEYGRRGLATFNEAGQQPLIGGDMIAVQIAGYRAFAHLAGLRGETEPAQVYAAKAQELELHYDKDWWNEEKGRFCGAKLQDHSFITAYHAEGTFLPLYYGAVRDQEKLHKALEDVKINRVANVEGKTYLPDIFYRYGHNEEAFVELKELVDPSLDRRDYPEVSYCVIGSMAAGLMGIAANGVSEINTLPRLAHSLEWAEMGDIPILDRTITVKHKGNTESVVTLQSGSPMVWKAAFPGNVGTLYYNGTAVATKQELSEGGEPVSYITIEVAAGETHQVSTELEGSN